MATLNLGRLKPVFRGAWNNATAYNVDDIVVRNNQSYISIQAGTNQDPATATAYWTLMAAAGTDVGATLTTQGDILYRDGSGLQRLAAGTAGNVLQTGGAGANPSWTAVSSDYVKLASVNNNDVSAASYSFDNAFTEATYQSYQLHLNMTFSNQNHIYMRFLDGSGSELSGTYDYKRSGYQAYRQYNDNSNSTIGAWNDAVGGSAFHLVGWNQTNNANQPHSIICEFNIPKPTDTSFAKSVHTRAGGYSTGNWFFASGGLHQYTGSSAVRGFKIYNPAGNITKLYATLYGLKK